MSTPSLDQPSLSSVVVRVPSAVLKESWFVVYCKRAQEQTAADNLQRQGYMVYLPRVIVPPTMTTTTTTATVATTRPLFPCYLFTHFDPFTKSMRPISATRGVVHMVKFAGACAVVPDSVIKDLQDAENADGLHEPLAVDQFRVGDAVRVIRGPFEGMLGTVVEGNVRIDYVVLSLAWVSRVLIGSGDVERVVAA